MGGNTVRYGGRSGGISGGTAPAGGCPSGQTGFYAGGRPCGAGCPCPEIRDFREAWAELIERMAEVERELAKAMALAEKAYYMARRGVSVETARKAEEVIRGRFGDDQGQGAA